MLSLRVDPRKSICGQLLHVGSIRQTPHAQGVLATDSVRLGRQLEGCEPLLTKTPVGHKLTIQQHLVSDPHHTNHAQQAHHQKGHIQEQPTGGYWLPAITAHQEFKDAFPHCSVTGNSALRWPFPDNLQSSSAISLTCQADASQQCTPRISGVSKALSAPVPKLIIQQPLCEQP